MPLSFDAGTRLTAAAAALLLAGCSGSAPRLTPPVSSAPAEDLSTTPRLREVAARTYPLTPYYCNLPKHEIAHLPVAPSVPLAALPKTLLSISDMADNLVDVFPQAGKKQAPIYTITTGLNEPFGMAVHDKLLYVANFGDGTVPVYKLGSTTPAEVLTGVYGPAGDVAVDPSGNAYVTGYGTNTIYVFAAGSTTVTSTLTDNNQTLYSIASDSNGDIFVNGFGGFVDEFPKGTTTPTTLPITYAFPGGLAVDRSNNLFVNDQGNKQKGKISEYAPPYTKPSIRSITYAGDIIGISVVKAGTQIWGANAAKLDGQRYAIASGRLDDVTVAIGPAQYPTCW